MVRKRFSLIHAAGAIWLSTIGSLHAEEIAFTLGRSTSNACDAANNCCDGCDSAACQSCCGPGTLFRWSCYSNVAGGPNLNEPLVTDRPDFTEASSTVGRGVSQIEFGYTYSFDDDGATSTRSNSYGEPLLRQGVWADWLEFRIAIAPMEEETTVAGNSSSETGVSDLYLGFKIALTPQACWLPEMAIIPQMNVPTGSAPFSSGEVEPGLNWIYSWEINDFISTAGSTQGNRRFEDAGGAYLEMAQSWTIAYSLTDQLGAFTEWYGIFPSSAEAELPQHVFNGGFTYLFSDNVQFDIRAGVGLNDAADDYFLGTGLSVRIP